MQQQYYMNKIIDTNQYIIFYIFYQMNITQIYLFFTLISITFQQCPSQQVDLTNNFVANGQFQSPAITVSPTAYPGGFYPWTTNLAQIGYGTDYNPNWGSTQVAALDTGFGQSYTQTINVINPGLLFFSINFAKRSGYSPSTSGLRIYWNGKNVAQEPTANDDLIHTITTNFSSVAGTNTLIIQAMGADDHQGTTIDNVGVFPYTITHRSIINGVCACDVGYFENGYNSECIPCSAKVNYCTNCIFTANLSLLTLNCTNNITSGVDCAFGTFQCTICQSGYYLSQNGDCQLIQINSNFVQSSWELQYISCNQFKGVIQIELSQYLNFIQLTTNNSQVKITDSNIEITNQQQVYKIYFQASYSSDIANETLGLLVYYTDTSNTIKNKGTIMKMKTSNIPLVFYTENECSSSQHVQNFYLFIVVISYIILFLSLINFKIIGLELFGVLQLAHFSLATHENVNIYLKPLLQWKYVNGYNVQTDHYISKVSNNIYHMGYKDSFFYNINLMFALIFLDLIVGGIIYFLSLKTSQNLYKVAMYALKLIFITFFFFNCLSLSFSIGLHFKYADPLTTQMYEFSTFGALLGIGLYIFAIFYLQFANEKQFGEYKNKFKVNCVNKFYIPLSIIYRFILGLYIAEQNQWYLGTLTILAASIAFIMFNIVNLPFKRAYHNYRANLCHITQLIILFVSNYYRSMKVNMGLNEKARIYWPAILQLVAISICVTISFVCLVIEIIGILKSYLKTKSSQIVNTQQIKNENSLNILRDTREISKTQIQFNTSQ